MKVIRIPCIVVQCWIYPPSLTLFQQPFSRIIYISHGFFTLYLFRTKTFHATNKVTAPNGIQGTNPNQEKLTDGLGPSWSIADTQKLGNCSLSASFLKLEPWLFNANNQRLKMQIHSIIIIVDIKSKTNKIKTVKLTKTTTVKINNKIYRWTHRTEINGSNNSI